MKSTTVIIGEQRFVCEIADTPETRTRGLMFRKELAANSGMLFDFQKEAFTGIWMKNTLIPLDIVWIDAEKNVLKIVTATPCTEDPCETFQVNDMVRWVLEVNAKKFPGKVGDKIEFEL